MSWNCRFVLKIGLLVATALASTYGYAVDGKIEGCPVVVRQAAMVGPVTSVKVAVTSEAVYRVSAAQMASAFSKTGAEITNALLAGQVRVANRGQVVPSECSLEGVSFSGTAKV